MLAVPFRQAAFGELFWLTHVHYGASSAFRLRLLTSFLFLSPDALRYGLKEPHTVLRTGVGLQRTLSGAVISINDDCHVALHSAACSPAPPPPPPPPSPLLTISQTLHVIAFPIQSRSSGAWCLVWEHSCLYLWFCCHHKNSSICLHHTHTES